MNAAVACLRCGAPVFAEDRFCGSCGAARTPTPDAGATSETSTYSARLLAMLRKATLGEYEIRGELGRGGMAAVYLAYDLRLNRKVAIKVMLPELAFHEGMEDRFKREARTAAKLDHPHIVVIYSVRDDAELLYFVMKFIEGASLEQLLRKYAPLPIPLVRHLLVQLAGALQYAHDEGVVHRDVKPANVLVDRRGNALVTDFGIAKATESPQLTRTGSVIGTPAYMSPEQCMGEEQTHASDQYALGVVAYEMIAGRPPFVGPSVELQWAHVKTPAPPLLPLRPDCPSALADAVMRMLAKDPSARWPSLDAALPTFAAELVPGDDSPRARLAEYVRGAAPVRTDGIAVTPASPIPPSRGTPAVAAVASVQIEPPPRALEVGETHQLTCTVRDAADTVLADREVFWASSNPGVAAVNAVGEITASALGKATIAATVEAITSTVTVEVARDRVAALGLTPASLTLDERATGRLAVHARNARGGEITGRQVVLRSSDVRVAGVGPDGAVVANAVGRATITATLEGQTAKAEIIVRPTPVAAIAVTPLAPSLTVGETTVFSAALSDASGRALTGRTVTWRSSNPKLLRIDATGRAAAAKPGTVEVTAECEGVSAAVPVAIAPPAVAREDIPVSATSVLAPVPTPAVSAAPKPTPAPSPAPTGEDTAGGTPNAAPRRRRIPVPLSLGAGALVVAIGTVVVLTRGRTSSSVDGPRGDSAVVQTPPPAPQPPPRDSQPVVQPPPPPPRTDSARTAPGPAAPVVVASLQVTSRSPLALESGETSRVTVRATGSDGRPMVSPDVTWTSEDARVATVSGSGTVAARAEGRTTIVARSGSVRARVDVAVSRPAPASVAIAPRPSSLKVGEQATLSARVRDRSGLALGYQVVWRSSNAGVVAVDQGGSVRGVRQGDATILVVAGGATDSIRLSVSAPASPPVYTDPPPQPPPRPADSSRVRNAPSQAELDAALVSAARAISEGFARGQTGQLVATGQFAKLVREDQPQVAGAPSVQRRAFADGKVEGDVAVPLRWKTFTGGNKSNSVVLRLTLEQQGTNWQLTAARNINNP